MAISLFRHGICFPLEHDYLKTPMLIEIGHDVEGMVRRICQKKRRTLYLKLFYTDIPPAIKMEWRIFGKR